MGPPGFVKLSSPALKLEQTANPAPSACESSLPLQLVVRHPATLAAMALCVGPHWHARSLSWQPAAAIADDRQGSYSGTLRSVYLLTLLTPEMAAGSLTAQDGSPGK